MQKINVIRKWIILEFKTMFFINSSCSFIDESYSDSIDPAEVETITTGFERLAGYPAQLHCSRLITRWLLRNSSFSNCNGHQSSIFRWVDNSSKLFFSRIRSRRDIHTKLQVCPWNLCIPLEPLTRKQYWQLTGEFLTNAFKCIFLPLSNIFKKVV